MFKLFCLILLSSFIFFSPANAMQRGPLSGDKIDQRPHPSKLRRIEEEVGQDEDSVDEDYYALAKESIREGNYAQALHYLQEGWEPDDEEEYSKYFKRFHELGVIYFEKGNYKKALECFWIPMLNMQCSSICYVAVLVHNGLGVKEDEELAKKFAKEAVLYGKELSREYVAKAYYILSQTYKAQGDMRNYRKFHHIAAHGGDMSAINERNVNRAQRLWFQKQKRNPDSSGANT